MIKFYYAQILQAIGEIGLSAERQMLRDSEYERVGCFVVSVAAGLACVSTCSHIDPPRFKKTGAASQHSMLGQIKRSLSRRSSRDSILGSSSTSQSTVKHLAWARAASKVRMNKEREREKFITRQPPRERKQIRDCRNILISIIVRHYFCLCTQRAH